MAGGSTLLSDLPGGPPDNQGAPDEDVIYDIVDEAYQDASDQSDSEESTQSHIPQLSPQERLGFQVHQPLQPHAQSHLKPPRFQAQTQSQNHPLQKPANANTVNGDLGVLTAQIRDALIVVVLVYFSDTGLFHSLVGRFVPAGLKTVDEETQTVVIHTLAVALVVGGLFYAVKVYIEPPNIILRLVQMYYQISK